MQNIAGKRVYTMRRHVDDMYSSPSFSLCLGELTVDIEQVCVALSGGVDSAASLVRLILTHPSIRTKIWKEQIHFFFSSMAVPDSSRRSVLPTPKGWKRLLLFTWPTGTTMMPNVTLKRYAGHLPHHHKGVKVRFIFFFFFWLLGTGEWGGKGDRGEGRCSSGEVLLPERVLEECFHPHVGRASCRGNAQPGRQLQQVNRDGNEFFIFFFSRFGSS